MTASACQPSRRGGRIRRVAADQLAAEGGAGGRVAVEAQTNERRDQLLEAAALLQISLFGWRTVGATRTVDFRAERSESLAMVAAAHPAALKLVGSNGQISLGKQYAGRHVLVEEREPGVWVIRTATVIPDNERWLHEPSAAVDLQAAMAWSVSHGPADAGLQDTLTRLGHGES